MCRWTCVLALASVLLCAPLAARPKHNKHSHPHVAHVSGFNVRRPDIVHFVNDVAQRDHLDRIQLLVLLKKARRQPKILEAMTAPAEAVVPWWQYRERVLTQERISRGAQFWQEHREALERIASTAQVPPEYLVAILGVETGYGRNTGKWKVLDSLATLGFDYPPRADYFREELEQFLLLSKEDAIDAAKATGSYAGAMGAPQFMPSAYRRYAVDGDGDHRRDLWNDWDDVLASVANFFKEHGWQAGGAVLAEAQVDPSVTVTPPPKLELSETLDSLATRGIKALTELPGTTPALLIPAEAKDGPAWRVGFQNFYVITRYNRSVRYAMAVHDLAQAIAQDVHKGGATPP
jgi:membrane-bound lytic murein transglycosylase B